MIIKSKEISRTDMVRKINALYRVKYMAMGEYECAIDKYVKCTKNALGSNRANDIYRTIFLLGNILGYTKDKIYRDIEDEEKNNEK